VGERARKIFAEEVKDFEKKTPKRDVLPSPT
jgi:hypothetical protein